MAFRGDYEQSQTSAPTAVDALVSPRSVIYCCGSCGYALNLSSSDRDIANIDSKYRKSIKKGIMSFVSVDESWFSEKEDQIVGDHVFRLQVQTICSAGTAAISLALDTKTVPPRRLGPIAQKSKETSSSLMPNFFAAPIVIASNRDPKSVSCKGGHTWLGYVRWSTGRMELGWTAAVKQQRRLETSIARSRRERRPGPSFPCWKDHDHLSSHLPLPHLPPLRRPIARGRAAEAQHRSTPHLRALTSGW